MKKLGFVAIAFALLIGFATVSWAQTDQCQNAQEKGLDVLIRVDDKLSRELERIQDVIIDVAGACPNRGSWLEQALTDLAACEAACTAAFNACSNAPGCGVFCQIGCSLSRLECNTGCNAVFALRAGDCVVHQ